MDKRDSAETQGAEAPAWPQTKGVVVTYRRYGVHCEIFTPSSTEAKRVADGLGALGHISDVTIEESEK